MSRTIATLLSVFMALVGFTGVSRADDFIGCIGEYRGDPTGAFGPSGCFSRLKNLHLPPKLDFWLPCEFAWKHPVGTDEVAAATFCEGKHMYTAGAQRLNGYDNGAACGYIIDRVRCVPR
jgi:hypothetical protein